MLNNTINSISNINVYKKHLICKLLYSYIKNINICNITLFDYILNCPSFYFKVNKFELKDCLYIEFLLFNKFINKFIGVYDYLSKFKAYYFKITVVFENLIKICKVIKTNFNIITEIKNNYIYNILKDNLINLNKRNFSIVENKNYNRNIYGIPIYLNTKEIIKIILNNNLLDKHYNFSKKNIENKKYKTTIYNKKNPLILNIFSDNLKFYNKNESIFELINTFCEKTKRLIFGQDNNIVTISNKLIKLKNNKSKRPIANLLFCGPSGTGKTELSKILSNYISKKEKRLIQVDMSECSEPHSASRLIGSPPGYKGSEENSDFVADVVNNPESIILFDEVEKAHKNIYSLFLQILEDGILTDSRGLTAFFNKSLVIFTSNLGSKVFTDSSKERISDVEKEKGIMEALNEHFSPELLNRLDDILIFDPIYVESLYLLIEKSFTTYSNINLNSGFKSLLSLLSYSPDRGARFVLTNINKITSMFDNKNTILNYDNNSIKCFIK